MQEQGALRKDEEGYWMAGPDLRWDALPTRVEAAISERIDRLPDPLRAVLAVASVQGEQFAAEVIAAVLGSDVQKLTHQLSDQLERQHRLVMAQGIQRRGERRLAYYRFRHILFQKYLYDSLDAVERGQLHEAVAFALESIYLGQPEQLAALAGQLAWHFEQAGATAKAISYLHQAGNRALHMAAPEEAMTSLREALALLATQPDTPDRADQELSLQLSLGTALIMGKGNAAGEVAGVFTRAELLAEQVGKTTELFITLWNQKSFYDVRAEYGRAEILGERLLGIAGASGNDALQMAAEMTMGATYTYTGRLVQARCYLKHGIALYDRQRHAFLSEYHGQDPGVTCLSWLALTLWILGYPDQAAGCSQQALALARYLDQPYTLTYALVISCFFLHLCGNAEMVREHAALAIALAEQYGYPMWLPAARRFHAWSTVATGRQQEIVAIAQFRRSLMDAEATGTQAAWPQMMAMLADLYACSGCIADALALTEQITALCQTCGERYIEPELYRRKGDLLLLADPGQEAEAEACYKQAIEVAQELDMQSWVLRATLSLARLWQRQGRRSEARRRLADIYAWFTEGFDSSDLVAARAMLAALA
jgi:adenylate cyclase